MEFDIIGIFFLAILFIAFLFGLMRGLFKTLISFIKSIVSAVISTFLSKPIAQFLVGTSIGESWAKSMSESLTMKGGLYASEYNEAIDQVIADLKLPAFITNFIPKLIEGLFPNIEEGSTVAEILGPAIVYYSFIVIAFIFVFLMCQLLVALLTKLFKRMEESSNFIRFSNRLLGGVLSLAIGFIIVCIITYGITLLVPLDNGISAWLVSEMKLEEDTMTVSKFFYENNFLAYFIAYIQYFLFK